MDVMIRPAEGQDAKPMLALLHQLQSESTTFMVAQDLGKVDDVTEADNISYLQSTTNNIILLAASDEGDLFGIISAAALPNHPREVEVGVAVLEAYQGFGLAQALIAEMLDWATEYSSVDITRLTVQAHNAPAIHIYEKFGFERVAGSDAIVLDGAGKPVAAFDMMLDITN